MTTYTLFVGIQFYPIHIGGPTGLKLNQQKGKAGKIEKKL